MMMMILTGCQMRRSLEPKVGMLVVVVLGMLVVVVSVMWEFRIPGLWPF